MILQFKNKHIFFCLESIWEQLDYKFKFYINQLVTENSEDEYEQEILIPEAILLQVFSSVTVLPEGMSAFINNELLTTLIPQLEAQSNLGSEYEEPNEAARLLIKINEIRSINETIRNAKILAAKNKILS